MSGCLLSGAPKRERTSTSWSIFCAARDVAIGQRVVAIPFHLRRPKLLYSWMPAAHRGHEPTILLVSASAVPSSPAPQAVPHTAPPQAGALPTWGTLLWPRMVRAARHSYGYLHKL